MKHKLVNKDKQVSVFTKSPVFLVGLALTVIVGYLPLLRSYFQQDEWFAFGKLILVSELSILSQVNEFFSFTAGHYVPFHHLVFLSAFQLFKLKFEYWAVFSIVWHTVNVVLVYKLVCKLFTREYILAFLIALLFGISASAVQATSWIGANVSIQGATTFAILSVYYFLKSIEGKNLIKRYQNLSIIFLFFSLLFKEIAIGMFGVYVFYILYTRRYSWLKDSVAYISAGIVYLLIRVWMIISASGDAHLATASQTVGEIIYNLTTFPAKMLAQTIVPQRLFIDLGYWIASLIPKSLRPTTGTTDFDLFAQSTVIESMSILIFLVCCFLIYRAKERQILILSFVFVVLNSFIFALSPERVGVISIMDSRNMYLVNVGVTIFVLALAKIYISKIFWRNLFIVLMILVNIFYLRSELEIISSAGKVRQKIVESVRSTISNKEDKIIIYTQSDTPYYGLPPDQTILPFQSGFGHTMLVVYANENYIPKEFFEDRFLWDITSEGYEEIDSVGFGYFRSFTSLQETYTNYTIDKENIYSFKWDGQIQGLTNISDEVRKKLE